jgi:hypothetical protein
VVHCRLGDAYYPKLARWHKILNRDYLLRRGRAECFASAMALCRATIRQPTPDS